ncbi:hypothetical protein BGZ91_002371 [Linnemannia elongata]|nr:hypothetical protein BGZ91_002371 [Linnemannia elongata]KAG0081876.1 hypothetical protein BGZ90_003149 [Linnemannia elongata]
MVKNSSVDEDYQDVVEAAAQVFINSFLAMDNPMRQTRIEAKELNRQWKNLIQGREEIGLEGDEEYLDEASINRQRLSAGTAIRLDLALFCRFTFSPTLDMERIQRVVEDFALLFLSKRDFRVNANQSPLRETYTQLVAILLAVYTRQTRSAFKRITIADIRDAIKADIIYGPISLPELRIDEAVQLAQYVANDTKRLESLYNNTLKKVIERIRTKDKSIPRPADKEALFVLQAKHDDSVEAIYRKEPKDKSVDEYRDEIWLPEERVQDNVATRQLQQEISDEWDTMIAEEEEEGGRLSSRPSASQRRKLREEKTQEKISTRELHREVSEEWDTEIEEEPLKEQSSRASTSQKMKDLPEARARRHEVREMSDIDMDMDMEESFERQPSKANTFKKKDLPEKNVRRQELKVESDNEMEESFGRKPSKASTSQKKSKQQQQQRRQPTHLEDDMDIDDIHRPPAAILLSQKSTKSGTSGSKQAAVRESRRIPVIQATKPRTKNMEPESRKRHKDLSDSDRGDSEVEKQEEEDEEDEEEEEEPVRRKKARKDNKEVKSKRRQRSNGSPSFPDSADGEDDGDSAEDVGTGMWANGRRRSRKWTLKEVQTLMELVPMFQYDESEVRIRKRTIKWAALKKYDRDHGHILRHRNQVMLKDKYREQTDQGKHRERVRALHLARQALKKQAEKEAEEAGAKKAARGKITRDPGLSEDGNDEDVYEEDVYEEGDNEKA